MKADKSVVHKDHLLYSEIWLDRDHICECGCGRIVIGLTTMVMHHILEKSIYPELRHMKENIMILHGDCHNSYHMNPDSRPKIQERKKELEEKYSRVRLKRIILYHEDNNVSK